jgi:hypothetical protein
MNGKTLTQEERDEVATKGWIEDQDFATKGWIEDQDFATKGWIMDQDFATKRWIEDQNYVNTTTFREAIDVLVNLIERQGQKFEQLLLREKEEFRRYVESLHENHVSLVSGIGEVYDFRIEQVEKRVDALEQRF